MGFQTPSRTRRRFRGRDRTQRPKGPIGADQFEVLQRPHNEEKSQRVPRTGRGVVTDGTGTRRTEGDRGTVVTISKYPRDQNEELLCLVSKDRS